MESKIFDQQSDYSKFMPVKKAMIDPDNIYNYKRVQDPLYSDLFDQCINNGGKRPSPNKKFIPDLVSS